MKKLYYLIFSAIFLSCSLFAQTMTSSKYFPAGTKINYSDADATTLSEGSSGMSQTWNFAAAVSGGNLFQSAYVTAASTPFAANFPGSTLAHLSLFGTDTTFNFQTVSSGGVTIDGNANNIGGTPTVFNYSNPQMLVNFPASYNTSGSDTYNGVQTQTIAGNPVNTYKYGTTNFLVDGTGTLITPTGSYPGCLRIKSIQHNTDSTVYIGLPITSVTKSDITTYIYLDVSGSTAYDRFNLSYDSIYPSIGSPTFDKSAQYITSIASGIPTQVQPGKTISVYPNPVTKDGIVTVEFAKTGDATYSLYDVQGKIVMEGTIASSKNKYTLSLANLESGIYYLTVRQGDDVITEKISKQ